MVGCLPSKLSKEELLMESIQIKLAALWTCLMLTYLLGDVLRIFSGDFKPGEIMGQTISQGVWLGIAAFMLIPILMVFASVFFGSTSLCWVHIIVAVFFFLFNAVGLPTYPSLYDKFLIVVGLGFNVITVWVAWSWK
jgi:hypothetical protein